MRSIISVWLLLWVFGIAGWIANIVKIVHVIHDPLTALTVFRMVGVVCAPLGAILGYC